MSTKIFFFFFIIIIRIEQIKIICIMLKSNNNCMSLIYGCFVFKCTCLIVIFILYITYNNIMVTQLILNKGYNIFLSSVLFLLIKCFKTSNQKQNIVRTYIIVYIIYINIHSFICSCNTFINAKCNAMAERGRR